jgi:dUTPase
MTKDLRSAEDEAIFVLNGGNTATVRTGYTAKLKAGTIGIVLPAPEAKVNVRPMFVTDGEVVLTVVNEGGVAHWVQPDDVVATFMAVRTEDNRKKTGD